MTDISEQVEAPAAEAAAAAVPGSFSTMTLDEAVATAVNLQRQKQIPQAEAILQAVLDAEPLCADALHFMGVLRQQQGRREEAVGLIRKAVEISPSYADAFNNLGNILRAMQRYHEALDAFRRATELAPEMAEAHLNLAGLLRKSMQLPQAAAAYRRAVELNPKLAEAHLHLGNALYLMGMIEEAGQAFENWRQIDPQNPVARHMAAACGAGVTPDRASDEFIQHSFDEFAPAFDEKMALLHYTAPALITAVLSDICAPEHALDVLDAGCGTGLCAEILSPYAKRLTGVDLSTAMVEKAKARGGYHELTVCELTAFLHAKAGGYDLIVSADTLVYFGALEKLFAAAFNALRPNGLLIFTVERFADDAPGLDYVLNPHGRYSHRESYLRSCLLRSGLQVERLANESLRLEMGQPVVGFVVTARKPV